MIKQKKLRIAQINTLMFKIPPEKYGGAERIVYSLTEGLVKKGHEVTLYATGDSRTSARLVSVISHGMAQEGNARTNLIYPMLNIIEAINKEKKYDILHFHLNIASDYAALPLTEIIKEKVVFTIHFTAPSLKGYADRDRFLRKYKSLNYISISQAQRKGMEYLNWIATVYNSIPLNQFTFNNNPKGYFLWVGKFNPDKGTKEAILAAQKANVQLLLAGAIDTLDSIDSKYYYEEIKPLIDDKQIVYVGEVGGKEKDKLFGEARGFLNPIIWNEPFGLVIAEALATGTPVISFNNGAASEIIIDRKTGYLVNTIDEMAEKIKDIAKIDRKLCREHIEIFFNGDRMIDGYESLYRNLLEK